MQDVLMAMYSVKVTTIPFLYGFIDNASTDVE